MLLLKQFVHEEANLGGYERLYPAPNAKDYEKFFVQGSGAMAGTKSAAAKFRTKAETQYCKHQIAGSRVSSQGPVPQGAAAWR